MDLESPFYVARATAEDMREIAELNYDCFPEWAQRLFLGCRSRQDISKLEQKYQDQLCKDKSLVWIKVLDKETGKIIAASGWNVFVNGVPVDGGSDAVSEWAKAEAPDWVESLEREKSVALLQSMFEIRTNAMHGPYLYLYVLFTHPLYQPRGAGSLVMEWGCNVADVLELPIWVEASDDGSSLYERFGFRLHPNINTKEDAGSNMIRDARGIKIKGGRRL